MKRVVGFLLVGFLVFYVISSPDAAAGLVANIVGSLGSAASSFSTFVSHLSP